MLNKLNISPQKQILIVYIVLTLATLAVFWQVNQYDFVNFDDIVYVTQNSHIQSGITLDGFRWAFSTTYAEFWHPLTWLSLMFDYQLYGLNAGGYHLTNLILHIMSTLLLFWLFNRMTGSIWRSAFIAALFALHPLHVESVAWIADRKDVLSAFFWMLTLCLYVYYTEKPVIRRHLLVLLCFACGLMSKSMVVTMPIIMILLDYWPLGRLQVNDQKLSETKIAGIIPLWQLKEKIPFFILSAVFSIITLYAQHNPSSKNFPLGSKIDNAPVSFVTYLEKTFWPHDLAVFYPFSDQLPVWQIFGAALLILVISTAVMVTVKRLPYLFVGWLWYAITLIPVIGIVQVGNHAMADRYTYIPLIGISIMLAWGIPLLLKSEEMRKKILFPMGVVFLAILSVLSWQQCGYWKNSYELFTHTLEVTENNYTIHCNLAVLLAGQGDSKAAEFHYMEALKIKPDDKDTNMNFGNLLVRQGRLDEAIERYIAAIKSKPNFVEAYNSLGVAYVQRGNWQKAIEQFSEAVKINPGYLDAQNNLKMALQRKQVKESASTKPSADSESSRTFAGRMMAGTNLMKKSDLDGAIIHFQEALKIEPKNLNAHVSMGLALGYKRNFDGAINHFRAAIKINPRIPETYNSLAVALTYTGKIEEAIVQLKKAIEINPQFAKAYNTLGVILAKTGKVDEGIAYLKEALRLDQNNAEAKKNLDLLLSMKEKK